MSTFPTLPTGPFEHISMDYTRLRQEGLRLLGRLGGVQWTDFNTHDPGITILEQLCYAITDLGYRTAYPMPDLLAGGDQLDRVLVAAQQHYFDVIPEAGFQQTSFTGINYARIKLDFIAG